VVHRVLFCSRHRFASHRCVAESPSAPVFPRRFTEKLQILARPTTPEIQSGAFRGFGIGAGFQYVGERAVNAENTANVAAYLILNAALYYRRENWEVQVNFNNITDEEYVLAAWGDTSRSVHPGAPFNAVGVIRVRF
jgi:outer membrane receptor protein involved in Fe transport